MQTGVSAVHSRRKSLPKSVPFALAMAISSVAVTAYATDTLETLVECRSIASAEQRLACYDQNIDAVNEIAAAASTKESINSDQATDDVDTTNTPIDAESIFGIPAAKVVGDGPEQIAAAVEKVGTHSSGYALITLDNGQVWRQVSGSTLRLAAGDAIAIKRKAFGSFRLSKPGSTRPMRVKRIK